MSSRKSRKPIRLIMFTSISCKWCPEIDRIVRKFLGSGLGANVNVTTVDVDLSPDIAEKYKVSILPSVYMNNSLVLQGFMSEDDIRDRMFNFIMQSVLQKDLSIEKQKEILIWLTRNMIESVSQKELIRPNIGDYVHLQALQISTISILALDPLASNLIESAGRMYGLYGAGQMMLQKLNPEIQKKFQVGPRFKEIIKGIETLYSNLELSQYPIYVAEDAKILNLTETSATLRLFGSAYAVGVTTINEPVCWQLAGEIAGMIQSILGKFVKVTETACWGLGLKHCDFFIEILKDDIRSLPIISDSGKEEVQERRAKMLSTMMVISQNHQQSLFLKKRIRSKIGDYLHISVVQQALTSLKLMDPYCGLLMYSAGSTYGLTGPGKHILQEALADKGLKGSLPLDMCVELVTRELQHPTTLLAREHSFVEYNILDTDTAEIHIHENVYSAGATDVKEMFCDFTAGFINGRLRLLSSEEIVVKEIACHASGNVKCVFQIMID